MAWPKKFAPGELVRPKRGGPAMKVDRYGDFDFVYCVWLDKKNNPQSKPILENSLEKIPLSNQSTSDSWLSPDKSSG